MAATISGPTPLSTRSVTNMKDAPQIIPKDAPAISQCFDRDLMGVMRDLFKFWNVRDIRSRMGRGQCI